MSKKIYITEEQLASFLRYSGALNDVVLSDYDFVSRLSLSEVGEEIDIDNLSEEEFIQLLLTRGEKEGEKELRYDGVTFSKDGKYAFGFHENVMGEEECDLLQKAGSKNIYITESQLAKILESRQLLSEAVNKVDNFDLVGDLINLTDPDKFFFVQIVKRWKDNKDKAGADAWRQSGRQANTYHKGGDFGNFASGTAFKVRTKQELLALKPQIVAYCDKNNARAYITCNPRSENAINSFLAYKNQKFGQKLNPWDKKFGFEHMAGQAKVYDPVKWPDRVRLIFDIDIEKNAWYIPSTKTNKMHCKQVGDKLYVDDKNYPQLANCECRIIDHSHSQVLLPKYPNQEREIQKLGGINIWEGTKEILKQNNIPIEKEYETPSHGLHIVIQDISKISNFKNVEQELRMFDDGKDINQFQTVHANFDGKLILYSNVDTKGY